MDLRRRLARWALARPRVLLVDPPGTRRLRWQVEAVLDRRGWPLALSPADADLLVVLGTPGPRLADAVDVLWSQTTAPRHRVQIGAGADVATELDLAVRALGDAGDDHHTHHDADVAGLPMAGTAPDRDGLSLDALRVTLGPVLPGWPTGLAVRGQLQGDVLTSVDVAWVDEGGAGDDDEGAAVEVVALDHLARFLVVAGWPTAANSARAARTALLAPEPDVVAAGRRDAARVARRVRRSRTLAWSVRGLGGDALGRVHRWCELTGGGASPRPTDQPGSLAEVAAWLEGAELAAARLILASTDLDPVAVGGQESTGA